MPWPAVPCPYAGNSANTATNWLFARGYGLHYPSHHALPTLPTHADVKTCASTSTLPIFHTLAQSPFALYLGAGSSGHEVHAVGSDLNAVVEWPAAQPVLSLRTVQVNTQQDAKSITWHAPGRFFAQSPQPTDLMPLVATHAALQFDLVIGTPAKGPVEIYMGCGDGCTRAVDVTRMFAAYDPGKRQAVSLPLRCFVKPGADLAHVDVPFGVLASPPFSAAFANVRIAAGEAGGTDAACPETAAR